MAELINVLKRINKKIESSSESYVYYDDLTGDIKKISNINEINDYTMLRVNHDQVKDIINGRYKYSDFLVTYDNSQKTNVLQRRDFKNNAHEVRDRVYKINQVYNDYYYKEIYKGVHVDVWYKELEHLTGQHVWYDNVVYKATKDILSNSEFDLQDYEKILSDVILYRDVNINLPFESITAVGQSFLDNNYLYQYLRGIDLEDLTIEQNLISNSWNFTSSLELQENINFRNLTNIKNTSLSIFATDKNDPNILYRHFSISVNDLLDNHRISIPFKYDWESTDKQVSMYTNKFFDTYVYRVIK
jgi:hypothetical protein